MNEEDFQKKFVSQILIFPQEEMCNSIKLFASAEHFSLVYCFVLSVQRYLP